MALAFAAHWVEARGDGLTIRYWPLLSRRIEYADLVAVDYRQSMSPWTFAGIGLRLAAAGVVALANRKGPGIGMRLADGREYVVILADDDELATLRDHVARARSDLTPTAVT